MKKFMMTLVVLCAALSVNAQVYLGGTLGVASVGTENGNDETSFKILPEIGYNFNKRWAVGTTIGYEKGSFSMLNSNFTNADVKGFTFSPYARYTFVNSKHVSVFMDMGVDFVSGEAGNTDFTAFAVGIKPGVAVNFDKHWSFVTKVGFLGYEEINPEGPNNNTHAFGFDVNGNNLTFGLYYKF